MDSAKRKHKMGIPEDAVTKKDLQNIKEEIVHQFHIVSEGLVDQIKLLAEGHVGILDRLKEVDERLGRFEQRMNVSICKRVPSSKYLFPS
jgi:hypothetical protein